MVLDRGVLIYLSASEMAREEKKSLKQWCIENNIDPSVIYRLPQSNREKLTATEKVLIKLFSDVLNSDLDDYKKRLLQMV